MGTSIGSILVWASSGSRLTPSSTKIAAGWVPGEQPACEWENERQYVRDVKLNQIISYLDAGVPLSDLISGDATIASGSIQIGAFASAHTAIDNAKVGMFGPGENNYVYLEPEGIRSRHLDGSHLRYLRPFSVDVSGLSWSALGDGYYATTEYVNIGQEYFSNSVLIGLRAQYRSVATGNLSSGEVQFASLDDNGDDTSNIGFFRVYSANDPGGATFSEVLITGWISRSVAEATPL